MKIEKMIKNFIGNIILIIEDDKVLDIGISLKKKNYEKNIDQKQLENSLVEVKDIFKENYQDLIIMHMIIVNSDNNENNDLLNNPNNNGADDVMSYSLYFTPFLDSNFSLINI